MHAALRGDAQPHECFELICRKWGEGHLNGKTVGQVLLLLAALYFYCLVTIRHRETCEMMLSALLCSVPCFSAHVLHRVKARWVDSCLSATCLENTSCAFWYSKIAGERGLVKSNQSSGVFFPFVIVIHWEVGQTDVCLDRRFVLILDQGGAFMFTFESQK